MTEKVETTETAIPIPDSSNRAEIPAEQKLEKPDSSDTESVGANGGADDNEQEEHDHDNCDSHSHDEQQEQNDDEDEDDDPLEEIPESEKNLEKSMEFKAKATTHFHEQHFDDALEQYELALKYCPSSEAKAKSVLFSNIAICYLRRNDYESAIEYTTNAIKCDPTFQKPYFNRVIAYEKTEKLEEALEDLKELGKMNPNDKQIQARIFVMMKDLEKLNEKRKTEVLSGLKSLGNTILGKFGLSLDNFKLNQNEGGSYNIQFNK